MGIAQAGVQVERVVLNALAKVIAALSRNVCAIVGRGRPGSIGRHRRRRLETACSQLFRFMC
jgi:hypothetical protein